ncbi:hypothetical protein HED60_14460 [Planctomycetales bacterium ZRK34]|nr:hypothetical protein HED60_14460 [Planctomycetales bacterium ZRK34]
MSAERIALQPLIQQLRRVRTRARIMLVMMRLAGWVTILLAVAMTLGLVDYALRLPSWLRAAVMVIVIVSAAYDVMRRLNSAMRVWPALTTLGLRLERMYPNAAGRIASAVAFATEPHPETDSPLSRQLAESATASAQGALEPRQVRRLIEPAYFMRTVLAMLLVAAAMVGGVVAAPQHAATAFSRWVNPFGEAAWPNRYRIESLTDQKVAPNNAPLRVAARVTQGDHETLRTWVVYKFVKPGQNPADVPTQRALMTRQVDSSVAGEYRRPIEPAPAADRMIYHFEAGDDATQPQQVQLIQPPTVRRAVVQVDPPSYAANQIPVERHDLLQPPRPSVVLDALAGSRVRLLLTIDGSFQQLDSSADADLLNDWVDRNFPGLVDETVDDAEAQNLTYVTMPVEGFTQFELSFVLKQPRQFRFNLTDAFGSSYEDQRLFRFEVRPDRSPRAAVIEPASDQTVLATAVIDLAAEAQDDVAIERARLESRRAEHDPVVLREATEPSTRMRLAATLDLSTLKLKPGDEVSVLAIAEDNFILDGLRHDPVESAARKLMIISEEEMTRQLRMDLAELRQRAIRARSAQQRLIESENTPQTAGQQRDMLERINTLSRSVDQVRDRIARNRMSDQRLTETAEQAKQLLNDTAKSAEQAATDLERSARNPDQKSAQAAEQLQQGRAAQQKTAQKLDKLVEMLDQGRDMYELKQKLTKLQVDQDQLAEQVRKTLPHTLGKTAQQLTDEQRQQLQQMRDQQQSLAEQAQQLTQRMRSAAAAIERQSEKPEDQANAEALRQAADTATRDKLEQKMEEAAEQTGENQLSQAQTQQQQASETISKMLQDMGRAEQLRQQILQRKLMELVEAIKKLRDQQQAQLDRLNAAQDLTNLDGALLTLRRNTMSVAESARAAGDELAPVAGLLDGAAGDQAVAVKHLRGAEVAKADVAEAESAALAKLEQALKLAEEQANKAQDEMTEQEREKLIKQYKALLTDQQQIRQATEPLAGKPDDQRDRRFRAASIQQGNKQADLRVAMKQLEEKVAKTIVYKSVHQQIDQWAGEASTKLRRAEPGALVLMQQRLIESSIQSLIDALKPPDPEKEFAEQPDGGGGGGGGGGGPQPLIPDMAEVQLLRTRQVQVHQLTQMVDQGADIPADERGPIIDNLSQQQTDLADTGSQLIQSLTNRNLKATEPMDLQKPAPKE